MHHRSFQERGWSHRPIIFVRTPENLTLSTFVGFKKIVWKFFSRRATIISDIRAITTKQISDGGAIFFEEIGAGVISVGVVVDVVVFIVGVVDIFVAFVAEMGFTQIINLI